MDKTDQREHARQFFHAFSSREDWLVLDTETTGADPQSDEVVEVSVLTARGDVLLDRMVRPQTEIDDTASAVHGIYWEDVEDKPQISGIPELPFLLTGHPVLIYNTEFDIPILQRSIRKTDGNPMAELWDPRCVMKAYAMAYGQWDEEYESYSWVKLEEACTQQGVSTDDVTLHRSLGDAKLTRRLVRAVGENHT